MSTWIQYLFKVAVTAVLSAITFGSLLNCADGPLISRSRTPYPVVNSGGNNHLIFYEDFETKDYKDNWLVHWGVPIGAGTVMNNSPNTGGRNRSAYTHIKKGSHKAIGGGEYVPQTPIADIAFSRIYLKLPDDFSMGTSRVMKLFAIKAGTRIENVYGGAGRKPTGKDKISVRLAIDNWRELFVYYYHPDQRSRWGDSKYSNSLFGGFKLTPGRWYCLELMVKLNTPGRHNGEIYSWVDGEPAIHIKKIRFRDTDALKIRRFTYDMYFGGSRKSDTSPKDQRVYIDNVALSRERIGCSYPGRQD